MAPKAAVSTPTTRSRAQPTGRSAAQAQEEEEVDEHEEEEEEHAQEGEEEEEEEESEEGVSRIKMRNVMSLRIHRVRMRSRRYQHAVIKASSGGSSSPRRIRVMRMTRLTPTILIQKG
jgi:hypothetical protein